MSDYFESGLFVRVPAWHEMGKVLANPPDTETAYKESGLAWQVRKKQQYYQINDEYIPSLDYALIRETDKRQLGSCRQGYEILQNKEAFEWCKPLIDSKLWTYETAGSLKNGERCWILLKQGERQLVNQDILKKYALFSWGHDGQSAICIKPTTIRVVCMNTLMAALREKGYANNIRHTLTMKPRLEDAKLIYRECEEMFRKQDECFGKMLDHKMGDGAKKKYIDDVLKDAYDYEDIDLMKPGERRGNAERLRDLFYESLTKASGIQELKIADTLYGVYNAIEESIEHFANPKVRDRGMSILYGTGKLASDIAFDLAMKLVS